MASSSTSPINSLTESRWPANGRPRKRSYKSIAYGTPIPDRPRAAERPPRVSTLSRRCNSSGGVVGAPSRSILQATSTSARTRGSTAVESRSAAVGFKRILRSSVRANPCVISRPKFCPATYAHSEGVKPSIARKTINTIGVRTAVARMAGPSKTEKPAVACFRVSYPFSKSAYRYEPLAARHNEKRRLE